jgi:putative membrane-bound dehydrogenase-like protein
MRSIRRSICRSICRSIVVGMVVGITAAGGIAVAVGPVAGDGPPGPATALPPFGYEPAVVPFYAPDGSRRGDARMPTMQKPLAAEASRVHAIPPAGFRVELFASEPLLAGKPLALAFDADGVAYVAESVDYPNDLVEPPADDPAAVVAGRDRIVRLVDTDGDGRADRREVFADGLSIPTSMLAHDGGLIVTMPPSTLLLRDTDGDGRADERTVLFTGWGTGDTHAGPSSLAWGLDGWVYGMVGYAGFRGTVGGEALGFPSGFFRFRPDGSRLEYLRSTNNNSWGFGFSEEGLVFGSTANGNPSEHMPLANRVYERVRGWTAGRLGGIAGSPEMILAPAPGGGTVAIRQVDHHGRFTAAAGHRLYTARSYPREYWNRTAFVCEPTGHLVATFVLTPQGAGFTSRMDWNLVASADEWTAPIQAEVGPDGQVWVIDWYNFIVQHNPTPAGFETGRRGAYVTPLRDTTRGRIWRIVHGPGPTPARGILPGTAPEPLVAALRDESMFWRERAQRRLVERAAGRADGGRDVVPLLLPLVADTTVDEIGLRPAAIHAIWTLAELGCLDGPTADPRAVAVVRAAARHPSAGVRLNAVKALPRDPETILALAAAGLPADPAPLVRLAVLEALGEAAATPEAGRIVMALLADPRTLDDRVLADAATSAAAVQSATVLPAVLAAAGSGPNRCRLIERVAEHVARGADRATMSAALVELPAAPVDVTAATLAGLARGWPRGTAAGFTAAAERAVEQLFETVPAAVQGHLVELVRHGGSGIFELRIDAIATALLGTIDLPEAATAERIVAAERLVALRPEDPAVVKHLLERAGGRADPALAAGLIAAVGRSAAAGAPTAVLDHLGMVSPAVREAAIRTIVGNRDWAIHLVERLAARTLSLGDVPIVERTSLARHPDPRVRDGMQAVLAAGGGLPAADRQQVIDAVLPVVEAGGDAGRGRVIFREQCGTCHRHGGEGGRVGPDLTGMAVHPPREILVHILDPDRSVEGNYKSHTIITADGRVVTGLLAAESRTAVDILDPQGRQITIQRDDIDEFVPSSGSLMPVGFEHRIPPRGLADLVAFLAARGEFLPLSLEKVATVVSTRGMFHSPDAAEERLVFDDWSPKRLGGVPFLLVDPAGDRVANVVMLHGPRGGIPPRMPREVTLPVNSPARAIHLLGGVAGWGFPATVEPTVSMIVRLRYDDGTTEDHPLVNGRHIADYLRRVDVPESEFAQDLRGRQLRHVRIEPRRAATITEMDLVKGDDATAPVVMAVTVQTR